MPYKTLKLIRNIITYPFRLCLLPMAISGVLFGCDFEDEDDRKLAKDFLSVFYKLNY